MTQTHDRPNLARKVTPKDEAARTSALDQGIRMNLGGEDFEVRIGDMTAPLARELRQNYGGSFNKLQDELALDPDIDSIAAFVWLARRMRSEVVGFDDVAVSYSQMLEDGFEITVAGREVVEDSPEA